MKLIILESPYAGFIERNITYARQCLKDSLSRGEAPIASHLLYTQVLNDQDPEERDLGIAAGLAWRDAAEAQVFYIDFGISSGMKAAIEAAKKNNTKIIYRRLHKL